MVKLWDQVQSAFDGRRVFVTGHTGFKGSWLCEWLLMLGARVLGFSLPPPTTPALFEQLGLEGRLEHWVGDVRDAEALETAMCGFDPDFVFHLAAQPLVRFSYREPIETWTTNLLGTLNVLEALRHFGPSENSGPRVAVMITTDKVYENHEWVHGYREVDRLGGHDPYSSSKAAAELAIASWRSSFFSPTMPPSGVRPVRLASVRAGNVIGGGDWAEDRIVPDCMRALAAGCPVPVRNPDATRPWQHVLEPLSGYLLLAARIAALPEHSNGRDSDPSKLCSAFNFGPTLSSNRPVRELVEAILRHWPGTWRDLSDPEAVHEARLLHLTADKAGHLLGWYPRWDFSETVLRTVEWYREASGCRSITDYQSLTRRQIEAYCATVQPAAHLPCPPLRN